MLALAGLLPGRNSPGIMLFDHLSHHRFQKIRVALFFQEGRRDGEGQVGGTLGQ